MSVRWEEKKKSFGSQTKRQMKVAREFFCEKRSSYSNQGMGQKAMAQADLSAAADLQKTEM